MNLPPVRVDNPHAHRAGHPKRRQNVEKRTQSPSGDLKFRPLSALLRCYWYPAESDSQMAAPRHLCEQPENPELTRMPVGAIASWAFAVAFGVAFWTLLFHVAPVIIRHL